MLYKLSFTLNSLKEKPYRKERRDGKNYLVVEGVAIVEGVLNGYLVPLEEFGAFVHDWNGVPISINHPKDGSAKVPNADVPIVGSFYHAEIDPEGKRLVGEFWLDESALRKTDEGKKIIKVIENNQLLEVSTGYFASAEMIPGTFDNQVYVGIHRDIHPDHVALLPNATGACSIDDGCGLNRNQDINPSFHVHNCSTCKSENQKGVNTMDFAKLLETITNALKNAGNKVLTVKRNEADGKETFELEVKDATVTSNPAPSSEDDNKGALTLPPALVSLSDWIETNGGFEAFKALLAGAQTASTFATNMQNIEAVKKDALIKQMVKNNLTGLSEDELKGLPFATLQKLEMNISNALSDVDYSGMASFNNESDDDDLDNGDDSDDALPVPQTYSNLAKKDK